MFLTFSQSTLNPGIVHRESVALLSVRDQIYACQFVWLVAIAIATGDVREDQFQIGRIRWKSALNLFLTPVCCWNRVVDNSSYRFCRSCTFLLNWL
ncbi:hypothetical protein AVEN_47522-1 [Araneus ventricosus]|uniref:Uncharacterized protein n=1 Tax=Araneus ventricosus TaxID=182803 RepID=A0A4Y2FGC3_ARAVE|nr:hypothetical protein AVEN_47522-1 [Araneus ventricosus]